jgi:hypothetical protein
VVVLCDSLDIGLHKRYNIGLLEVLLDVEVRSEAFLQIVRCLDVVGVEVPADVETLIFDVELRIDAEVLFFT